MHITASIVNVELKLGSSDPTIMEWLTAAAFIVAALLCGAYALCAESTTPSHKLRRHRAFWWSLAVILLLLGINKQLDLQSWLTAAGRQMARNQGWYSHRRNLQILFVASFTSVGFVIVMLAGWKMRHTWRQSWLALLGVMALMAFVIVRASSFHYLDQILILQPAGFSLRTILELGGIGCIGISAAGGLTHYRKKRTET